ncbi:MAG: GNAT family N-acetyltransferase [Bacteroidales bacterium]|jgi:RimJ/RimL family protein N-acetyltransferase
MIVKKGNLVFRRLTIDDIELVRNWRNSSHINQYMEYREYITPEMQERWFNSINNQNNLYFIVEFNDEKIGVFNGKDIDWDNGTMETGIFIADEKYLNTEIPLMAVLTFGELGLRVFNMNSNAHILKSNHRAIRFNKLLGFELCEGQDSLENQLYKLNKERFFKSVKLLRPTLQKLMKGKETLIIFNKNDIDNGLKDFLFNKIDSSTIIKIENNPDSVTVFFELI